MRLHTRVPLIAIALALCISCGKKSSPTSTAGPICSVSPTTLDFGSVDVGRSKDLLFRISNVGTGTLSGSISASCSDYHFSGGADFDLNAGQYRDVTITFAPQSGGPKACALTLTNVFCSSVGLNGNGEVGRLCSVAPSAIDFGSVVIGTTKDTTFTITNLSPADTLEGTVGTSSPGFSIIGTATYKIDPGGSKTFTVRYAPAPAATSGVVNVGDAACVNVTCTGNPVQPVTFTINIVADMGSSAFSPSPDTLHVGQWVVWHNARGITHTATADGGAFDTGGIPAGSTSAPIQVGIGSYPYHCTFHPTMSGSLVVIP